MKKLTVLIIVMIFLVSGCATVDENIPRSKGVGNALVFGALVLGGLIVANRTLND